MVKNAWMRFITASQFQMYKQTNKFVVDVQNEPIGIKPYTAAIITFTI